MISNNSWVEINTQNLKHNISQFRRILLEGASPSSPRLRRTSLMAVVKSNAYGHGLLPVAKSIQKQIDFFGVVNLAEALELRKNKITKPILVLSYYFDSEITAAIKNKISLVVYSLDQAKKINLAAKNIKKIAKIHFKYDTGTSRLGVVGESEALKMLKKIKKLKNIKIEGIFSHFAASEENQKFTDLQLQRFNSFAAKLEKSAINIPLKHFACSAAAMVRPDSRFNLIRLGVSLYGLWPSAQAKRLTLKLYPKFNLKTVLAWKTLVIAVKYVTPGTCVGYGCTYRPTRPAKLAILPVGYYEGYDRHLSNKGEVLINGVKCPVRGRVSMNLTIVEVTKAGPVKVGDEVVLIGRQGKAKITVEDLADIIGTINYEVVARINPMLPRILK